MLKAAVVGWQSLVLKRLHEVSVTKIRLHWFANLKTCKHILSYNANALYLSTMLHDMPCGKERVVHYQNWLDAAVMFTERVKAGM